MPTNIIEQGDSRKRRAKKKKISFVRSEDRKPTPSRKKGVESIGFNLIKTLGRYWTVTCARTCVCMRRTYIRCTRNDMRAYSDLRTLGFARRKLFAFLILFHFSLSDRSMNKTAQKTIEKHMLCPKIGLSCRLAARFVYLTSRMYTTVRTIRMCKQTMDARRCIPRTQRVATLVVNKVKLARVK